VIERSLLTIDEAAQLVDVSVRTVRRWISAGLLDSLIVEGTRRALYLDLDVYRAQRDARQSACINDKTMSL
jgi:excisionase family DNA binding protein